MITLGSLFSGAGGFELAGAYTGITSLWASEVEPFCIRVTSKRFPEMIHLGDIGKIDGGKIPPVDVITFGSPCQDLSTANASRQGLDGERSGLFMEAIRVIREMREATNGGSPTFIVWENVPGAYSSNGGEDFRRVLEETAKTADPSAAVPGPPGGQWQPAGEIMGDGYSVAWRTYDAQYWGVPQRRRRIFLVADFGGGRAGKIQFERDSLLGDIAPGRGKGEGTARKAENCADVSGGYVLNDQGGSIMSVSNDIEGTLRAEMHGNIPCVIAPIKQSYGVVSKGNGEAFLMDEKHMSITSGGGQAGQGYPCVLAPDKINERIMAAGFNGHKSASGDICYAEERSPCIEANMPPNVVMHRQPDNVGTLSVEKAYTLTSNDYKDGQTLFQPVREAYATGNGQSHNLSLWDKAGTLNTMHDQQMVVEAIENHQQDGRFKLEGGVIQTMSNKMGTGGNNTPMVLAAIEGNGTRPSHLGDGYSENDVCYTLNTVERHTVACEVQKALPIDLRQAVKNGAAGDNCGMGVGEDGQAAYTVMADQPHGVAYSLDRASYNQGKNAKYDISVQEEKAQTLVARGLHAVAEPANHAATIDCRNHKENLEISGTLQSKSNDGHSLNYQNPVQVGYRIRRLTPLECARLQGFPDWWMNGLETPEPTDEEIKQWMEVFETHRQATDPVKKPKTAKQVCKWLQDPRSDSAEYKMWGNSIAIPCAYTVLAGIAGQLERVKP